MRLPVKLALRYVFKPRSRKLVHIISGISMFVIAMVTAAMIIVLSAFNGLERLVQDLFGTLDSELALIPKSGEYIPIDLALNLEENPNIAHYSAVIESEATISANGVTLITSVLGVDSNFHKVTPIERALKSGSLNESCCILGSGIKSQLMLPSDSVMMSRLVLGAPRRGKKLSRHKENAFLKLPSVACGVFAINYDLDTRYIIAPIDVASELFQRENEVSRFELALSSGSTLADLEEDSNFMDSLGETRFRTREEKHRFKTQINRAEKWSTFVILSFILIVAAFNVLASLTMMLIDKEKDLEIFKAMGLRQGEIEKIFSLQGLAINVIGGLAGAILGILLVLSQTKWGFVKLAESVTPSYPVMLKFSDIISVLAVVICLGGLGSAAMVRYLIRKMT